VIAAVVVVMLRKKPAESAPAPQAPAAPPASPAPTPPPPPTLAKAPEPPKQAEAPKPTRPATLQVEALAPSMTDEAPMLGSEDGELRIGTDEMPKFGTEEMPRVGTAQMPVLPATGGKYRTPAAKDLAAAIASGMCPKCKAPTFVGDEATEDGITYTLNGRCGACGHKAHLIDMKV